MDRRNREKIRMSLKNNKYPFLSPFSGDVPFSLPAIGSDVPVSFTEIPKTFPFFLQLFVNKQIKPIFKP
jgi:hypothetical protein